MMFHEFLRGMTLTWLNGEVYDGFYVLTVMKIISGILTFLWVLGKIHLKAAGGYADPPVPEGEKAKSHGGFGVLVILFGLLTWGLVIEANFHPIERSVRHYSQKSTTATTTHPPHSSAGAGNSTTSPTRPDSGWTKITVPPNQSRSFKGIGGKRIEVKINYLGTNFAPDHKVGTYVSTGALNCKRIIFIKGKKGKDWI